MQGADHACMARRNGPWRSPPHNATPATSREPSSRRTPESS